jgi:hypothetical protein
MQYQRAKAASEMSIFVTKFNDKKLCKAQYLISLFFSLFNEALSITKTTTGVAK